MIGLWGLSTALHPSGASRGIIALKLSGGVFLRLVRNSRNALDSLRSLDARGARAGSRRALVDTLGLPDVMSVPAKGALS
jgi:hypothetical protein